MLLNRAIIAGAVALALGAIFAVPSIIRSSGPEPVDVIELKEQPDQTPPRSRPALGGERDGREGPVERVGRGRRRAGREPGGRAGSSTTRLDHGRSAGASNRDAARRGSSPLRRTADPALSSASSGDDDGDDSPPQSGAPSAGDDDGGSSDSEHDGGGGDGSGSGGDDGSGRGGGDDEDGGDDDDGGGDDGDD